MNDLKETSRRLEEELRLLRVVSFRHYNQHRRSRYFVAFRSILRLSRGVCLRVNSIVSKSGNADGASSTMVSSATSFCSSTAIRILLLSKDVTSRQQGAAFAGLMAILIGGSASCLMLVLRLRDILRSTAFSAAPAAATAVSGDASIYPSPLASSISAAALLATTAAPVTDRPHGSNFPASAPASAAGGGGGTAASDRGTSKKSASAYSPPTASESMALRGPVQQGSSSLHSGMPTKKKKKKFSIGGVGEGIPL